ncbi:MAG: HDOD domain-containing protein [Opitutaceae bacterium]
MSIKKKILFVDDERYVLDGLRRMLRPMRNEWEMIFVESGEDAIEQLDRAHFDVLVSDMRMPGIGGAELLNLAMAKHPCTVRLILSGYADESSVMECVNATHQFLAKPCDPEILRRTIERACLIEERSRDARIMAITTRLDRLPSIPVVYDQLLAKMRDPDATIETVAAVISRDPAMCAKILKLVNSAFFGLRRHVTDLADAVNFLGIETIRSLTLSIHAFTQFEAPLISVIDFEGLWNHSIQAAGGARAIAESHTTNTACHGEAFTAGLLHDMGRLVLAANFPEASQHAAAAVQSDGLTLIEAERKLIGFDHAEVGAALFALWGLPEVIVECVAHHHEPSATDTREVGPLTFLHLADSWLESESRHNCRSLDRRHLQMIDATNLQAWENAFLAATGTPLQR